MPGEVVDGNDLLAVEDAVARALARARDGDGPTFLEMKTFRRMQHSMRANLPDTRDAALVAEWEAKDPLPRLESLLRELGELDDERLRAIEHDVEREVESAIETALADPDATPTTSSPPRSHRSGAIRSRRSRRSGRSASSPPCARRSSSSSRPTRT